MSIFARRSPRTWPLWSLYLAGLIRAFAGAGAEGGGKPGMGPGGETMTGSKGILDWSGMLASKMQWVELREDDSTYGAQQRG